MSLTIKVRGGTLQDHHICNGCSNSQFMVNDSNTPLVYCQVIGKMLRSKIVQCNHFAAAGAQAANYKMRSLAWQVDVMSDGAVRFEKPTEEEVFMKDGEQYVRKSHRRTVALVKITTRKNPTPKKVKKVTVQ